MSDAGRKDFIQKAKESITPDSQKSYAKKAKETTTNASDSAAKKVEPEQNKGLGQKLADVGSDSKKDIQNAGSKVGDDASANIESYLDTTKEYLQAGKEHIKSAIHQAGDYIHSASEDVQKK